MKFTIAKIKKRLWNEIVSKTYNTSCYVFIYKSYWHYLLTKNQNIDFKKKHYFTARPNPGAGIGHQ